MKAASAITLNSRYTQEFGSGGSSAVDTGSTSHSITNSWARYTANVTLPSVVGKTIGAGSSLRVIFDSSSINVAVDIWGVQLEAGSVATPFKRNAPSIQAELAACQRYYFRIGGKALYENIGSGWGKSSTVATIGVRHPVTGRIGAGSVDYSTLGMTDTANGFTVSSVTLDTGGADYSTLNVNVSSGLTQFRPYHLFTNASLSGYVGLSMEL
jgi:hypothetical protein